MITGIIVLILLLYAYMIPVLIRDIRAHWQEMRAEPGNPLAQGISSALVYFLSAGGISDFALCTALYHKLGWAETRLLPGTLNVQCAVPGLLCGIVYLLGVGVDITTLLPCLAAFVLGAFLSPRFAMKLPTRRIRQLLLIGLLFAGTFMLLNKLHIFSLGGEAMGLSGIKLIVATCCYFCIGVLKAMGIGSYPLTMAMAYFLGLHPLVAYPLMMGGGALASPLITVGYVRMGAYMRRLALFSITTGLAGSAIAIFFVKSLDISTLQWLVIFVIFFAAFDISQRLRQEKTVTQKIS